MSPLNSLLLLTFTLFISGNSQAKRLQLEDVCKEFIKCNGELERNREFCLNQGVSKRNQESTANCEREFGNEFENLRRIREENKNNTLNCIHHSLKTETKRRFPKEKVKFCSQFVKLTVEGKNCSFGLMKMENKCQALRQCCDSAGRCEQSTEHSESGRKERALMAELEIRMADCKQGQKTKKATGSLLEMEWKRIKDDSYCPRYLKCQKDLVVLRSRCAVKMQLPKSGIEYSWNPSYNELQKPLDVNDFECKVRYSKQYEDILKKRKQAQDYLEHCVPVANVTREFVEKQLPCEPDALMDKLPSDSPSSDCLLDIFVQNKQCLLLRNCCVQADVCERNAMYGMLADEYLLAVTALKTDMDACYHQLSNIKL